MGIGRVDFDIISICATVDLIVINKNLPTDSGPLKQIQALSKHSLHQNCST